MIEYVKNKKPEEIIPFGYKNLGFFTKDSKELNKIIVHSIKENNDIQLLMLTNDIYQTFVK